MSKLVPFFKRFSLAALVLAIGLAALPTACASGVVPVSARGAASLQNETIPPANRPAKADEFITNAQSLIDKANQTGWDTSAVQVALNAFTAIIPTAQAAHNPGAAIIASHNGFNADGKVTDRAVAVETVKALGQVLKDTRLAMNRTGQALREAVKAYRNAHRPAQAPATP
ncbi:MAG: hypothetical protein IMZ73_00940 [Chloroflexi bacterium]|nr:hypothetical protein [Chloroflexota bacterium]